MARRMKDSGIEWIGTIPDDWQICKLKNIIEFKNGYAFDSSVLSNTGRYPVIRIGDIKDGGVDIFNANKIDDNKGLENFLIKDKDILLAMSGATVGKLGYVEHIETKCYINQRVGIIRAENSKYIYYYLSTDEFIKYVILLSAGSAQPNISTENVNNYYLSVPNKEGQKKIITFLDEKIGDINEIISKTKESIEEYKKYKQAVITEVITQGLDKSVALVGTDNIHIPKIPTHWKMKKMKYIFEIKKDVAGKEGYDILSITQKGIKIKDISKNEGQLAQNYSNYQLVDIGDFAMNHMDLLTGWVDISRYAGVTSPDYRVFRFVDATGYDADYYLYLMKMCYMNRIFYGLGQGVSNLGRWRLQADKFLNFMIPEPPLNEQKEIADYLDTKCGEIDALITKKEAFVEEMETYKKSLIYEYVTGKKEVV